MGNTARPTADGRETTAFAVPAADLHAQATALLGYLDLLDRDGLLDDPALLRVYLATVRGHAANLARVVATLATAPEALATGPTLMHEVIRNAAGDTPVWIDVAADAAAHAAPAELGAVLRPLLTATRPAGGCHGEALVRVRLEGAPPQLVLHLHIPQEDAPRHGEDIEDSTVWSVGLARRAAEAAGGSLLHGPTNATYRVALPLRDDALARRAEAARAVAARADQGPLEALQDIRSLRAAAASERQRRDLAVSQQLRAIADFRAEHRRATELAQRLDAAYLETITALARAVEARDTYTGGHVERVRAYSMRIADRLSLSSEARRQLEFGAVLHDIGKVGVPDDILRKPGPLDPAEWDFMRRHPEIGRRVLEGIPLLAPTLDAVAAHHERWDGHGYPHGIEGERIPLAGRIVAVADAYDAMTSDRPYRNGLPVEVALAEIEHGRGTQFDPDVSQAFLADPPPSAPQSSDPATGRSGGAN